MGNASNTSPNMDSLAKGGALFRQTISNGPRTPSAFPPIMCSLYPLVSGEKGVPENATTWAETMQKCGYKTAGFNLANPYLSSRNGYGRGFDQFADFWDRNQPFNEGKERDIWSRFKKDLQDKMGRHNLAFLLFFQAVFRQDGASFLRGGEMTDKALSWITQNKDKPFFTWIHYMDVHYPYLPMKDEYSTTDTCRFLLALLGIIFGSYSYPLSLLRRLYERRVRLVDNLIGQLLKELKAMNLFDNTAIVITSDHGDMFHEHGGFCHQPELYDELLRVPLIVKSPQIDEHRIVDQQVSLINLPPTILEMLEIERPRTFQGESILPLLEGDENQKDHYVFSEATHMGGRRSRREGEDCYRIVSCRSEEWKYIVSYRAGRS
jgi:arylsulfatase A-like enzyme